MWGLVWGWEMGDGVGGTLEEAEALGDRVVGLGLRGVDGRVWAGRGWVGVGGGALWLGGWELRGCGC